MPRVQQQTVLSGVRKAAIVTLMLGEEATAELFRYLSEPEIERLAKEMAALGAVPPKTSEEVLEEFHQLVVAAEFVTKGDMEQARRLLVRALGEETARRVMDRILRSLQSTAGFASLEKADPEQLSKFILGEHPQTIALILAHLNSTAAAELITLLPDDLRVDVLTRMAKKSTGSSTLIKRATIADFSLSLDKGEITDKGTINQRMILDNHPQTVEKIYLQNIEKGIVETE